MDVNIYNVNVLINLGDIRMQCGVRRAQVIIHWPVKITPGLFLIAGMVVAHT